MTDLIQSVLHSVIATEPMSIAIFVLAAMFIFIIWRESSAEALDWKDMITSKGSNRVSLTKVLQLVGGVTATWIMIHLTLTAALDVELLFVYLTYVGAIEAWSKFVAVRYGSDKPTSPSRGRAPKSPTGD